tara:strand:- start:67 stop:495 length:429 start_codon:yes stop_codon:yes gene_type:complete
MADKKPIKTIVDHIGRTVVGVLKKEDTKSITLFNPVIVHVQPDPQSGQLQVQSFPYIFMEFLKDKEKNDWTFNKAAISTSNVELDERITQQYENINNPSPPIQQQAQEEPEVIQLFDDDEEEATTTTPSPADACCDTSSSCC